MKKKFITYIVMGMLAVCIAGCGNSEEKSNNTEMKENVQSDNKETDENNNEETDNSENENEEKESDNLEELFFLSGEGKDKVREWDMLIDGEESNFNYYYYGPSYGPLNDYGNRYKFYSTSFFVDDEYNEKYDGSLEEFFIEKINSYSNTARVCTDGRIEEYTGEYVEINGYEFYKFNGYILADENKPFLKYYITGYVFDVEGYKGMMFSYVNKHSLNDDEAVLNEAQHNVDTAIKGFRYEKK